MNEVQKNLNHLMGKKDIQIFKDKSGMIYVSISGKQGMAVQAYPLHSRLLTISLKKLYLTYYNELLSSQDIQYIYELLEVLYADKAETVEVCKRIYNDGYQYAYELNAEDGTVVWIENGEISIGQVEGIIFKHSANYANQVMPDFDTDHTKLLDYIEKHFNIQSDSERKLLALYLVTSLWGLSINHPILILTGEKGSSKSTTLRKLERLIDPKTSDLGSIPKGADGLELRLSNSYFVPLDNLSSLSRRRSDTLARSSTGSSESKRALYTNADEIVLDIKAVVALNGVSVVAKESDLLDRSVILKLSRISSKSICTEEELWAEFEKDRPAILGCCFQILALALNEKEPIQTEKKIRMADFHVACIRVGRVIGISEKEVSRILWANQKSVNQYTIDESMVALCVLELMKDRQKYINSMTGLLRELKEIAEDNGMSPKVIPESPNHLRIRLDKVQNNLETEYGIFYVVKNVGTFKKITLEKKCGKLAKVATKKKMK